MDLVFEKSPGKWEVAWTWMPFFLAADSRMIGEVDKELQKMFQGKSLDEDPEKLISAMNEAVISLVAKRYPLKGLGGYLRGVLGVEC